MLRRRSLLSPYPLIVRFLWKHLHLPICDLPVGSELLSGAPGFRLPSGREVRYGTVGYWLWRYFRTVCPLTTKS